MDNIESDPIQEMVQVIKNMENEEMELDLKLNFKILYQVLLKIVDQTKINDIKQRVDNIEECILETEVSIDTLEQRVIELEVGASEGKVILRDFPTHVEATKATSN